MTNVNWERVARAAGIGFVVLFIVAFAIYGEPPKVSASAGDIVGFFDGDRSRVLTSMIIFGIAYVLFLWFIGAIANTLREAGEGRVAATTIAAAGTFVGIQAICGAIAGGLALNIAATGDDGIVTAFNTLLSTGQIISAYPLALIILFVTAALGRAQIVPDWHRYVGTVAAIIVLLYGTTWATSGFWSATGGYLWVNVVAFLAWTVITSGLLYVRATAEVPERAAVPTT